MARTRECTTTIAVLTLVDEQKYRIPAPRNPPNQAQCSSTLLISGTFVASSAMKKHEKLTADRLAENLGTIHYRLSLYPSLTGICSGIPGCGVCPNEDVFNSLSKKGKHSLREGHRVEEIRLQGGLRLAPNRGGAEKPAPRSDPQAQIRGEKKVRCDIMHKCWKIVE